MICWDTDQGSPIHNHADNGCVLKVLEGELLETQYKSLVDYEEPTKITHVTAGMSSYIDNGIGVHKIESPGQQTVSMHIYSPPKYKGLTPATYRLKQLES